MTRQPRAKTGKGGYAPSMKGKDPRQYREQPTVAEDTLRARALQRLSELPDGASSEEQVRTLNDIIRILLGQESR